MPTIYLTEENDALIGGNAADTIMGLGGDDSIDGAGGDDFIAGGDGADTLRGNYGDDTIEGGNGNDEIEGLYGNDLINGGSGDDHIFARDDDDLVYGGPGLDTLIGGLGTDTLFGGDGDDLLAGSQGDDEIHGGDGDDVVFIGPDEGSDRIFLGAGDDILDGASADSAFYGEGGIGNDDLRSGAGNDTLDGGQGIDFVLYSGDESSYTLTFSESGTTILDRRAGQGGTDVLIDVENLQFANSAFDIGIRSGAVGLSSEDFAAITEIYIAYFDRAPAAKGLFYWATRLDDGMTLPAIAESFFVQPETQRTYEAFLNEDGSLNNTQAFVTSVFNNVLGRDPTSPYWVNELDNNPEITPAIFILAVLNGAKAETGGAADAVYLETKTDVGVYFSAIKGLSDYDDTVSVMNLYDGSDASITRAVAEIDRLYEEALDPITGEFLMSLVGVIDDPFA